MPAPPSPGDSNSGIALVMVRVGTLEAWGAMSRLLDDPMGSGSGGLFLLVFFDCQSVQVILRELCLGMIAAKDFFTNL